MSRTYCHTHSAYDCPTCADEILSLGIQVDKDRIKWLESEVARLEACAARTVPEWISVTDRLPEQDVSFLAVTDCGGDIYISTMRLPVLISKNSKPDGDFIRERVTHWMPLPAAPEVKK